MNRRELAATVIVLASSLGVSLWLALAPAPRDPVAPGPFAPGRQQLTPLDRAKLQNPYPELGIKLDDYPKVDGSTSTQPLQMILPCKLFGLPTEWVHLENSDTRHLFPSLFSGLDEMSREEFDRVSLLRERIAKLVQPHGTHESYVNLIDGRADLALVARLPSDEELALASHRGVALDVRPVALDAFVFLLNSKNPVASLTIEQVRDIYSGRITNWRQVGGPDAPIQPYQRSRNSGSQELMQRLVMKGRAMIAAPDLLTGTLMSWPFLALDKDVHGIGYSVYYYQEFMAPRTDVKACAVEGVLPTSENIRARRYPLIADVYVVVRGDLAADHAAGRLRDWLLGPLGQPIVEESGYVAVGEEPMSKPR